VKDTSEIRVISFDCYGTLVNWEAGILSAIRVVLAAHGAHPDPGSILEDYAEFEAAAEEGEYTEYTSVLRAVVQDFGVKYSFIPTPEELEALGRSLPQWKPFDDTVDALQRLKRRYRLAVLSNVDEGLFSQTVRQLQVELDVVITASQVRSYKPSPENFRTLLSRVDSPPGTILHAAQSLYHDIVPARQFGMVTAWVNRQSARARYGATRAVEAQPDIEVPDLSSLASRLGV
jgi:2-haloacid dehalogenase